MALMISRRSFFLAPAIVAATSLMPGHSIAKILTPPIRPLLGVHWMLILNDGIQVNYELHGFLKQAPIFHDGEWKGIQSVRLTEAEIAHYTSNKWTPVLNYHPIAF